MKKKTLNIVHSWQYVTIIYHFFLDCLVLENLIENINLTYKINVNYAMSRLQAKLAELVKFLASYRGKNPRSQLHKARCGWTRC